MMNWMSTSENKHTSCLQSGKLLFFSLFAFMLSGCSWLTGAVVVIKNTGPDVLDQVRLEVGGGVVNVPALQVGESAVVKPEIMGDSSLRIVYLEKGLSVTCDGDVYFTNNMRVRVNVEIGGGVCRVIDVTD
jgi:hypothetical protein